MHYNARPGNQNHLIHGGEAAVERIRDGGALTGPAREAELQVYAELATEGRAHVVRRNAARLQAACDCYWSAIVRVMERMGEGEPADIMILRLDKFVKRFGWLAGASLRAWAQVKEEEQDGADGVVVDYEELLESEAD